MSGQILQLHWQFRGSAAEYERAMASLARAVAAVPGLCWTVWLIDAEHAAAGALHLFADETALHAYLAGPFVAGLASHPRLRRFRLKQFAVLESMSALPQAPA